MKGEVEEDVDVKVDYSNIAKNIQPISGSDRYNIRTLRVDISNCASLFYVFLPNYESRDEPEPRFEYSDDQLIVTYTFIARDTESIFAMLKANELVDVGYELAVQKSCKKSSWQDDEECEIQIQFPFIVEERKFVKT